MNTVSLHEALKALHGRTANLTQRSSTQENVKETTVPLGMSGTPIQTAVFTGTNKPTNEYVLKVLKALHEETVKETDVPPGM